MTIAGLYDFIAAQSLGVLSTVSPQGEPQSALVGIAVTRDLKIVFDTLRHTRKARNLEEHACAAFVIGWSGEITVQFEGTAFQPSEDELDKYKQVYFSRWPDGVARQNWPGMTYFVVRPKWIRYSDYDQRPPLIEEFRDFAV